MSFNVRLLRCPGWLLGSSEGILNGGGLRGCFLMVLFKIIVLKPHWSGTNFSFV